MRKTRWIGWLIVLLFMVSPAQAEFSKADEKEIYMELISYDFGEGWNWGGEYIEDYQAAYSGIDEETNRRIMENQQDWIKILLRIQMHIALPPEAYTYIDVRMDDFTIENCHDLMIYPRYCRLSEAGEDTLAIGLRPEGDDHCIFVEAIALYKDQDLDDLNQRINQMIFTCNVEFEPYTAIRYKKSVQIYTQRAYRETRFVEDGVCAFAVKNGSVDDGFTRKLMMEQDMSSHMDNVLAAYEVTANVVKHMPYNAYCLDIVSDSDAMVIIYRGEDMNPNRFDLFTDDDTSEIDFYMILLDDPEERFDPDDFISCISGVFLEFSTEFIGTDNGDCTPSNGAPGVRFRVPLNGVD